MRISDWSSDVCSSDLAWPVYLAAGCLAALVPLVTNFDLRMQRNVVPVEDAVAAIVAGLCLLALSFGIAVSLLRVYRSGILSEAIGRAACRERVCPYG